MFLKVDRASLPLFLFSFFPAVMVSFHLDFSTLNHRHIDYEHQLEWFGKSASIYEVRLFLQHFTDGEACKWSLMNNQDETLPQMHAILRTESRI